MKRVRFMTANNSGQRRQKMKQRRRITITVLAGILTILAWIASPVAAQDKPNIVVIMGDDIGWSNIGDVIKPSCG